jgi:carbonic anhydrase
MTTTNELLARNEAFANDFAEGNVPIRPNRKVAVLACMDARLDVYRLLGLGLGEAHVIRNAGGVVTEDAIRSLVISQQLIDTREIVLIHHTDCAMLTFQDDDVKAEIFRETGIRPSFALEAFSELEEDVRQSIARLRTNPFIRHKESIRGFIYEVETGRLREVARA